ncbi:MAG TPA: 3-hydroxyacyl-CoA dehydrogenase NAD-binding domain-containing protein, partial [Terriglobales bacterium]|nr:3-hydroxyacyl-CoA dehydrogenase NAD-binding domain-containing protein [Terriglobales bacterium]
MNTHSVPFAHLPMHQSSPTHLELVPAATLTFASVNMETSPEKTKASPMTFQIGKVAVLGAGTMGSRIAAHLANAGVPSYLLDIV